MEVIRPKSHSIVRLCAVFALAAVTLFHCAEEFSFQGVLGSPIAIQVEDHLPLLPALADDQNLTVALDIGAAVTSLGLGDPGGTRRTVDLRLFEATSPGRIASIARLLFPSLQVFTLPETSITLGSQKSVSVGGIVGADVLEHFAIQFELFDSAARKISFLDERPGSSDTLASEDCLAVFDTVPHGGGEFSGSSCVEDLPARRLLLPACLEDTSSQQANFEMALSTAVGPIVLAESSMQRLRPKNSDCEPTALRLPNGAVEGACRSRIARAALVSNEDDERGPCTEQDAPRAAEVARAAVAAVRDVDVVIVPDAALSALRLEVGAETAVVDGLVGAEFLGQFRFGVDYPASRLTFECPCDVDGKDCACEHHVRIPARSNRPPGCP